jgi:electron transport complex protein RnfG
MASSPAADQAAPRRALRAAAILAAATVVAFGLLTFMHETTRDDVAAAARARTIARFAEVLGEERFDNDLLADVIEVRDPDLLGTSEAVPAYRARLAGRPVAVVLAPVAPNGYSGAIRLLVGIRADGRVLGVRVTQHRETPGLGDGIDVRKSDWIRRFEGTSLGAPPASRWKVKKDGGDFDQFTGATITPRAVVGAVANALVYFGQHREELLAAPATMPP